MTNQKNKLILNKNLFLGEGTKRRTYAHPHDESLCIKISSQRGQRSAQREIDYFKRLHKRGVSFEMLADFKGKVDTNFGKGDLHELVRDYDGNISKNLGYYLLLNDKTINAKMVMLIEELRLYLRREYILFSDLDIDNILVQQETKNHFKLIVIDGIGDNNQIPFLEYIHFFGTKRSIRKWDLFALRLIKEFPNIKNLIKKFNE